MWPDTTPYKANKKHTSTEQVQNEYTQLMNWAKLYDNCSFDAKKMIVAQKLYQ